MVSSDIRAWFRDLFRVDGSMRSFKEIKRGISEKMDVINDTMVSYNIQRYYQNVAELKGVSYSEAVDLCAPGGDPELTLGLKLADPGTIFQCTTKKGTERFKQTLTPEELKIFTADEKKIRKGLIRGAKGKAIS